MIVAVDLGSNTLRGVQWECLEGAKGYFEEIVRLGEGVWERGYISEEAVERVIEGLNRMKEEFNLSGPELKRVKGIGTEALRRAKNRNWVLGQIRRATGIRIKVISPSREAFLGAIGVERCLRVHNFEEYRHFLMVDIGGGSTEITLRHREGVVSKSFPVGIVKLAEQFRTPERIALHLREYRPLFREFFQNLYARFRKPKILVGSSGTPTTLANLKHGGTYSTYDRFKVNGTILTEEEIREWYDRLLGMEMGKREELVGVGRGDLIGAGIQLLLEVMKSAQFRQIVACNDGVLEGVVVEECRRLELKEKGELLKKLRAGGR